MILDLANNAGITGFKRLDAYDSIEQMLPVGKSREQKLRIVSSLLLDLAQEKKIEPLGRRWRKITS